MRTKTLLSTTKRVAYLGTLAMGLLIALASCEAEKAATTNNAGGGASTAPLYVGTYTVDSLEVFAVLTLKGAYSGDVTIKDTVGGTDTTASGTSININASITIAAGDFQLDGFLPAPVPIPMNYYTRGNLTSDKYTIKDFTATVKKLSDTRISIGGITLTKLYPGAPAGATATLYLTKKK